MVHLEVLPHHLVHSDLWRKKKEGGESRTTLMQSQPMVCEVLLAESTASLKQEDASYLGCLDFLIRE